MFHDICCSNLFERDGENTARVAYFLETFNETPTSIYRAYSDLVCYKTFTPPLGFFLEEGRSM